MVIHATGGEPAARPSWLRPGRRGVFGRRGALDTLVGPEEEGPLAGLELVLPEKAKHGRGLARRKAPIVK